MVKFLSHKKQFFNFYGQHMEVVLLTVVAYTSVTLVGTHQDSHKYRSLGRCFKKEPAQKHCG